MTAHIIKHLVTRIASVGVLFLILCVLFQQTVYATAGVNRTINFQGKVVNKTTGLNVSDGNYDFTFDLYNASSGGSPIWTENWTGAGGGQLTITNGIFHVALGSYTTFASAGVDFNNDSLYLEVTFNSETMGSRIQMTAVPYALSAETVAGLTVTNNGGNTLDIAANKTFTVNNTITFSGTDSTTFTLPTSNDTIVGLAATQSLTNKTIGSTGLTFSGATTDVTTGTNESFSIVPNGTGNVGIGTTTTAGLVTIGNSGRTAIGKSLLVLDQYETNGDLFTASASGTTKFRINNSGQIYMADGSAPSSTTNMLYAVSGNLYWAGTQLDSGGSSQWTTSGSDIYYDTGNVAIGTTVANAALEITGNLLLSKGANRTISIQQAASGGTGYDLTVAAGAGGTIGSNGGGLYLASGAPQAGTAAGSGLIDIRTPNADGGGDASGTISIHTGSASSAPTGSIYIYPGTMSGLSASNQGKVILAHNGSSSIGNVGIGTTTPGYKLDVAGDARFTGAITVSSCTGCGGGTNYWQMNSGSLAPFSTSLDLLLGANATSSALVRFGATTGANSFFNTGGNVGIGTTAPIGLLNVSGGAVGKALSIMNVTNSQDIITASVSGATKFTITNAGDIQSVAGAKWLPLTNSTTALNIANAAGTSFVNFNTTHSTMRVGTTFNVYTTGNEGALHVGGSGSSKGTILENTSSQLLTLWSDANGGAEAAFTLDGTSGGQFAITNGSSARIFIDDFAGSGPNVGIGNGFTAPTAALHVEQIAAETSFRVDDVAGDTTPFIIDENGNVGIGTTTVTTGKFIVDDGGSATSVDLAQLDVSGGVTATGIDGLQIDYATAGTTASADNAGLRINVTSNNSGSTTTLEGIYIGNLSSAEANSTETGLRIGTGWDVGVSIESGGLTISGGSFAYSGSARPTKTVILAAEYPGAILTASGSATTNGSMTSDASPSATFAAGTNNWMNYYEWTSTQSSLQDYTVAVRAKVPSDFSAWNSTAIQIYFNTQLTLSASNKVDVIIYRAGNSSPTPLSYRTANVSTTAKTWKTVDIPSTDLSGLSAGDSFVIYLKLYAKDSNYVQIGDISMSYLAGF